MEGSNREYFVRGLICHNGVQKASRKTWMMTKMVRPKVSANRRNLNTAQMKLSKIQRQAGVGITRAKESLI